METNRPAFSLATLPGTRFSDEDREACYPLVEKIVSLAELARRSGVLALEAEAADEPSIFMKTGLMLIIDGTDPQMVAHILHNLILAEERSGEEQLKRVLMAEGILSIQQGENPRIIAVRLCSILGEKYLSRLKSLNTGDILSSIEVFVLKLNDRKTWPECEAFEQKMLNLSNWTIPQAVAVAGICDLKLALQGCGLALISKIFQQVSQSTCLKICDGWEDFSNYDKGYVLAAQDRILKKLTPFEEKGPAGVQTFVYRMDN